MSFFTTILDFFAKLFRFSSNTDPELRRIYASISNLKPPYYKLKNNLVMPGFAHDLFLFCQALKPLINLADRTLAHPDLRIARRFFDYLIDTELPPEQLEQKNIFFYDGMKLRLDKAIIANEEQEKIAFEFQHFIKTVDSLGNSSLNKELLEAERFVDICRYDWERILGFFDPGITLEDSSYRPDFLPADGEQLLPELIDVYYSLENFKFSTSLYKNVMKVFRRYSPKNADAQADKITKLFSTLNKILEYRLSNANLLAVIRLAKNNATYKPEILHDNKNYVIQYRDRIVTQYEKDRERLQREWHENAVATDIKELFNGVEVLFLNNYNEINDSYLRRENPNGFSHVKALSIMKTFVTGVFEKQIKEWLKKILVEGYFDNKIFQNSLANIIYQCDRTIGRIDAFDNSLAGNGRISISNVKRYVEEMRHGKDITIFLNKLIDEINFKAKEICEDETGLFQMLAEILSDIISDYKKSSPELVNNIRSMGGVHNKDLINAITDGKNKTDLFLRIMRNFAYVKVHPISSIANSNIPTTNQNSASDSKASSDNGVLEELDNNENNADDVTEVTPID